MGSSVESHTLEGSSIEKKTHTCPDVLALFVCDGGMSMRECEFDKSSSHTSQLSRFFPDIWFGWEI